jgi:hypothetical protein
MHGLESYFKQVGVSVDKNDWTCVRITHGDPESRKAPLDEQTYPDPRYPSRPLRLSRFIVRERLLKPHLLTYIPGDRSTLPVCDKQKRWRYVFTCTPSLFISLADRIPSVLVIATQTSSQSQAQYRRPLVVPSEFPGLRQSSDIAWLAWKTLYDQGARLNLIITWTAVDQRTQRLISTSLGDHDIPDWQRKLQPYPWAGW